ncbi:transmembrane protein, putative (macronuclear) [Tetrahymena thermophila SB210]|uniref:Transmembrane protein, putative n=1 Tax=Tetrahymena thermophila (strain SB210) TaxID=312017 RepID=Q22L48_TETTS|nr:transmembrane protein, putative [Tetrahymena thermophila SB210]EAR85969.1 transmembrane protein, putative [Tetrahymena thermophila SB210]|eukprot:XP_976564.1 transmembrane protein, putative [Tetrahymena thermophila SB210]
MRISITILLALAFFSLINADIGDITTQTQCLANTGSACNNQDSDYQDCIADYNSVNQCTIDKGCSISVQSKSSYTSCVQKCQPKTDQVQKYFSKYLNCINSSRIISAFLITMILAVVLI